MTNPEIQTKHLDLECRFSSDETGVVEGIASRWNEPDAYGDLVQPGAFASSLAQHRANGTMPAMLWLHGQPCGAWEVIEERNTGLYVRGKFALNTETGSQAYEHARAGTTTGLSIGFRYVDADAGPGGTWIVRSVDLHEISLTPIPAAPRARITQVRSQGTNMTEQTTPAQTPAPEAVSADAFRALQDEVRSLTASLDDAEIRAQRGTVPARPGADSADVEARALASFIRTGDDTEIRAASSDNDPAGGFFILPTIDTTIRNLLEDVSPIRSLAEVVTISGNTYERFYSKGNRGAQWVGEKSTRPQDTARPELIKHTYSVAEMYAAPAATRHLVEDASFDVAGWFNTWVANDFALTEGDAFWNGDGIDGKPRGLLTYPINNKADATRDWGELQYTPAGHASAPTDDNLAKALVQLVLTLHPRFRGNAKLLVNNATYIRFRQLQDTAKRFLWAATGNLVENAENGSILGYPVVIDDHLDDIGADKIIAAFGDFSQGYVVVDRHGLRVERDAVTVKGTILYDTYSRVGGGLGDSRAIKFLKVAAS